MKYHDIIKSFIIGGFTVALFNFLITNVRAKYGSLVYAFPLTFVITCLLIFYNNNNYRKISEFTKYGFLYFLSSILFFVTYYFCSQKIKNKYNIIYSLLISISIWLLFSIFIYNVNNLLFIK
mgnify:CR=1 FL=1